VVHLGMALSRGVSGVTSCCLVGEIEESLAHASGFLWFFQAFCLVDWGGAKKYIVGHAGHSFGAERS
ncbi:MAG: hypothetical protein KDA83_03110, partial [Planctomycetales bacterium]|nr:hypothetical protein [Planctomycetales bacterium]